MLIAVPGVVLLGALVAGFSSTDALIRATSACFIGVYVLALLSAVRILERSTSRCPSSLPSRRSESGGR